jgi:DNA polymerase-1
MTFDSFKTIWAVDYEFRAAPGERPAPVCMIAHELHSGRKLRLWEDELKTDTCPYNIGPDSLVIAYYASAEMGCHLALNWPQPHNVIDLFAEFRVETNGMMPKVSGSLLGALAHYGHGGIDAMEKDAMRDLILRGGTYSESEREAILDYCASDVVATEKLFRSMEGVLSTHPRFGQALLRGRYTKAVAHIEHNGVPIDDPLLARLREQWNSLKEKLIARVDNQYGVYDGRTFKLDRFEAYLKRCKIPWPTLASGRLALDEDTFKEQCKSHPELIPLKDLRQALGRLRLSDLAVGSDNRNRTLMSMFRATTGRNQPSTSRFVFGLSSWLRGLVKPAPGYGLAYVDWSQQEFGIAAALSGDARMREAYQSGDPYLAFAKQAGAVPAHATKASHAREREQYKACVLAVQYGMQEESLARRIVQPVVYARELLKTHHRTYATFWDWSDGVFHHAMTTRKLWTVFGWTLHVGVGANGRSLRNFPMQANGAEMLRLACCLGTEAGIRVVAPVHDAVLIEAPLDELDAQAEKMQALMRQASATILDGFELRSDVKFVRAPERFQEERGADMWCMVQELLNAAPDDQEVTA